MSKKADAHILTKFRSLRCRQNSQETVAASTETWSSMMVSPCGRIHFQSLIHQEKIDDRIKMLSTFLVRDVDVEVMVRAGMCSYLHEVIGGHE